MCADTVRFVTMFERVFDAKVCLRSREGDARVLLRSGNMEVGDGDSVELAADVLCIEEADEIGGVGNEDKTEALSCCC